MIKFETLNELEHLLAMMNQDKTYILPLNLDGRLGFPISYDKDIRNYIRLDRHAHKDCLFHPIEELPNKGWVLTGEMYVIGGYDTKKRWFHFNTVSIGAGGGDKALSPTDKKLDEFIYQHNEIGEFSVDDKIIVDIIRMATELKTKIIISWMDSEAPVCLWLKEEGL